MENLIYIHVSILILMDILLLLLIKDYGYESLVEYFNPYFNGYTTFTKDVDVPSVTDIFRFQSLF